METPRREFVAGPEWQISWAISQHCDTDALRCVCCNKRRLLCVLLKSRIQLTHGMLWNWQYSSTSLFFCSNASESWDLATKDANETEFAMIAEFFVLHCSVRLDRGLVVYKTSYMAELEDSCREKVIWHKSRLGTSFIWSIAYRTLLICNCYTRGTAHSSLTQ